MNGATDGAVVFGAGGLLGTAVARHLDTTGRHVVRGSGMPWGNPDAFAASLDELDWPQTGVLDVFWCAGGGHVGASAAALAIEARLLERLVAALHRRAAQHDQVRLVLASSAGAVWAGARDFPARGTTPVAPIHDYGRAKLEQERVVADGLGDVATIRLARIANLYGGQQRLDKPQGLLSHLVANVLRNRPTSIFVPLDTARDYVWVDDAAADLVAMVDDAAPGGVRLVASGQTHTIAEVVAVLGRVLRRRVPLTHSVRSVSADQPRVLAFVPDRPGPVRRRVTIGEGIGRLVDARVGVG